MKMTNIVFVGATFSNNKGSTAMLMSAKESLETVLDNPNFVLLSIFSLHDLEYGEEYGIKVVDYKFNFFIFLSRFIKSFLYYLFKSQIINNDDVLKIMKDADLIVDLSGDGFSDLSGVFETIASCYDILLVKLLNKPIAIYAQSIGPFNNFLTRHLSKFSLNKVDLLIVREKISENYLKKLGVRNEIHLTADAAFILEPLTNNQIQTVLFEEKINIKSHPIIGISVSQHLYKLYTKNGNSNRYIETMAKVSEYLIKEFNANILFIPHVTNNLNIDDRSIAQMVYNEMRLKDNVSLINSDYSPKLLKRIIGNCDLFVGARMHANIAALSMNVPTIAIAYSHKFYGIMGSLGMLDYVIDYKELNYQILISKINEIWANYDLIKNNLSNSINIIKANSTQNANLVKNLINNSN